MWVSARRLLSMDKDLGSGKASTEKVNISRRKQSKKNNKILRLIDKQYNIKLMKSKGKNVMERIKDGKLYI